jgi:protein-tyrosine-phosphatase
VLFLCSHNSTRSQIAEGPLRGMAGDRFEVFSAGTEATRVRPEAISVMAEIGVDISAQESETLDRYLGESLDLVITVCDDANEACPVFPVATKSACGRFETCGMRSEPVSKANWLNQGCDPNLAPSGATSAKDRLLSSAS